MKQKHKTYAATKGCKPFDWNRFLARAIKRRISSEEIKRARHAASMWVTCACGNQCRVLPRDTLGRPNDRFLADLGYQFSDQVGTQRYGAAKRTLAKIEKRSSALIEIKLRSEELEKLAEKADVNIDVRTY